MERLRVLRSQEIVCGGCTILRLFSKFWSVKVGSGLCGNSLHKYIFEDIFGAPNSPIIYILYGLIAGRWSCLSHQVIRGHR